jgi:hypothetical protein
VQCELPANHEPGLIHCCGDVAWTYEPTDRVEPEPRTDAKRTMVLGHIRPGEPPVPYLPKPETEEYHSAKSRVTSTLAMLDYLNELAVILLCGVATW